MIVAELLSENFFSYIMERTWQVTFRKDDDDVRFVLDQHGWLDFYSANSLKQQSAGRHVSPLGHFIPILTKPVFVLST